MPRANAEVLKRKLESKSTPAARKRRKRSNENAAKREADATKIAKLDVLDPAARRLQTKPNKRKRAVEDATKPLIPEIVDGGKIEVKGNSYTGFGIDIPPSADYPPNWEKQVEALPPLERAQVDLLRVKTIREAQSVIGPIQLARAIDMLISEYVPANLRDEAMQRVRDMFLHAEAIEQSTSGEKPKRNVRK